jgi:outer membrane immunogenic protein
MTMKIAVSVCCTIFLLGTQAFGADMALKAPPARSVAVPYNWTGFYLGGEVGGGWSDTTLNYSPNDQVAAPLLNGNAGIPGQQPFPNVSLQQAGVVGGFELGYNWQFSEHWLVGAETDFSFSGMRGQANGTSVFVPAAPGFAGFTNIVNASQTTDWYGTIRGRVGWLATPNLLLFGTGGFAYGRVDDSANHVMGSAPGNFAGDVVGSISAICFANVPCYAGASSAIRTGWSAGGGAEWLFDQHWSAKIEYQFVNLGTETEQLTALATVPLTTPSSFNISFHEQFHVVRVGLNYNF